jgi:hypothetical protein
MLHRIFPLALDKMAIRAVLLPPGLCVLYYPSPCNLTTEKTRKGNGQSVISLVAVALAQDNQQNPLCRCSESLTSFTGSGEPFFFNYVK